MTLDKANRGEKIEIIDIKDAAVRVQAIRLGLSVGSCLYCSEKIPSGPVILQNKTQELAVGRKLAKKIYIAKVNE